MTDEQKYRKKLIAGYRKSPELLSRLLCRVFWQVEEKDHLLLTEQMVTDVTHIIGLGNIERVCDEIAKVIIRNAEEEKEN